MKKGQKKSSRAEMFDRAVKAKHLYARGWSMRMIATEMGYSSVASVFDLIHRPLDRTLPVRGTLDKNGVNLEGSYGSVDIPE